MNLAKKGTIISIREVAEQTVEVAIKVPEGFSFFAGQYIWLMIPELEYPDPKGNTRMWSITSSPNRKGELEIIFRTGKSGYKKTLVEMEPGEEIVFSGPFGPLRLPENNSLPVVLIAGGVGVAPFLSMIRLSTETHSGHKITLVYANNSKEEAAYLDELIQIEKENSNFKLSGFFGLLQENQLKASINGYLGQKVVWSIVGPDGFVNFVSGYLSKHGVSLQDIAFESTYPKSDSLE